MRVLPAALVLLLAGGGGGGCGGGDNSNTDSGDSSPDASGTRDGALPDSPAGCSRPQLDQPWVQAYVQDAIATLAAHPRYLDTEKQPVRMYLRDQLIALGYDARLEDFNRGTNVVATLAATTETADAIIVGAHFDTVPNSPGADDNASGTALVLAVARYVKDVTCRKAAVTFVLFDSEEEGLFGSRAYAQAHSPASFQAVHTFDQIGWNADGDRNFELELPTPTLQAEWLAAAPLAGATISITDSENTDHQAFRDLGYAADGLSEEYRNGDTTPHYHMPSDVPADLDYAYLATAAKLCAQVVMTELSR